MARPKMFYKYELPQGVIKMVRAICADYERRKLALAKDNLAPLVKSTYLEMNEAINKALGDCEEKLRSGILTDIASCKGYDWSNIQQYISRNAYYSRKSKIIYNIATNLSLI